MWAGKATLQKADKESRDPDSSGLSGSTYPARHTCQRDRDPDTWNTGRGKMSWWKGIRETGFHLPTTGEPCQARRPAINVLISISGRGDLLVPLVKSKDLC